MACRSAVGRLWLRIFAVLLLIVGGGAAGLSIACLSEGTTIPLVWVFGAAGVVLVTIGVLGVLSVGRGSTCRVVSFTAAVGVLLVLPVLALVVVWIGFRSDLQKWIADLKKGDSSGSIYSSVNNFVRAHETPCIIGVAVGAGVQLVSFVVLLACRDGIVYRDGDDGGYAAATADGRPSIPAAATAAGAASDPLLTPASMMYTPVGSSNVVVDFDENQFYHGAKPKANASAAGAGAVVASSAPSHHPKTDAARALMNEKYGDRFHSKRRQIQIDDDPTL